MSKYPVVSGREVIRALSKAGFVFTSQKGSHVKLKRKTPSEVRIVIVLLKADIKTGTLKSILRQAHISLEEFKRLLES